MIFIDEHDRSIGPKCLIIVLFAAAILASALLMFTDVGKISDQLGQYRIKGNVTRQIILLSCLVIYFFRVVIMLFVFFKRKLLWLEALPISILMSFLLFAVAYVGGSKDQSINFIDIIGILLYLSGSFINSHSEYLRHIWKRKPENKGRLYTGGWFKYSMHINYFGDIVFFTGLAMMTHTFAGLFIPFFMTLNFVFILIPSLDKYLEKKYGKEFKDYAKGTKKFIPLIY
ncbi:MAG: DUF1295 domain-containing protein [Candidatus Aminicenantes bacterium]|nr:MAG: DUF1295 domain-containing protein [Candidatus Aminicenantes bacterium]